MRVHIAGLGLMGGSLAAQLSELGATVGGSDSDGASVRRALEQGWLCEGPDAPGIESAEVLVLALPPAKLRRSLPDFLAHSGPQTAVTDLASVKVPILAAAAGRPGASRFLGGHPLCGRERGGIASAGADLYPGCAWILTPNPEGEDWVRERVAGLVDLVGGRAVFMSAAQHDRLVARISHLPQILASSLAALAAESDLAEELNRGLFGGGWRDMTRLAASPPALWNEILGLNREELLAALAELRHVLEDWTRALGGEDSPPGNLLSLLERGAAAREDWLRNRDSSSC